MCTIKMILAVCLYTSTAAAGFVFVPDAVAYRGSSGERLNVLGTLFNDGGVELFLNGLSSATSVPDVRVDETPFFSFTPLSLLPGQTYVGPVFDIVLADDAQPGSYEALVVIAGGPENSSADDLAVQSFRVDVTSGVPEPKSWLSCVAGFVLFWASSRRFRSVRTHQPGRWRGRSMESGM